MLVFDATALDSLLDSYLPIWSLWDMANDGELVVFFPACAIVEIGQARGVTASEWEAILFPPSVEVLPLGQSVAAEIGCWPGTLAARHVLWEARALDCPILTRDASLYTAGTAVVVQV